MKNNLLGWNFTHGLEQRYLCPAEEAWVIYILRQNLCQAINDTSPKSWKFIHGLNENSCKIEQDNWERRKEATFRENFRSFVMSKKIYQILFMPLLQREISLLKNMKKEKGTCTLI